MEVCLGTPEPIFRGVFVADGEKDAAGAEGWPAWGSLLAANTGVMWEKVMENNLPGQHQPFSASFCHLLQHSIPLQALSSRGYTVKLSFLAFLAFTPWCMSSSCHSPRKGWHQDLTLLLVASQRVFLFGLISAGLHDLKAHQDLELGCLLSVILRETAHVLDDCSVIRKIAWVAVGRSLA